MSRQVPERLFLTTSDIAARWGLSVAKTRAILTDAPAFDPNNGTRKKRSLPLYRIADIEALERDKTTKPFTLTPVRPRGLNATGGAQC